MNERVTVNLEGGPETVLWCLHDRASEALRSDGMIRDPEAIRIYQSIDFDYQRVFGVANGGFAMRSLAYDSVVRAWMARHPGGTVVELGCGLETSFWRVDDGVVSWICVDVPEVLAIREKILSLNSRCKNVATKHVGKATLDLSWMDEVDPKKGVFITAQGLLMYFEEPLVRTLITAIFERFPGVELAFDTVPRWTSKKSVKDNGVQLTPNYRLPPLPWGVNRDEIGPLLRSWTPKVGAVEVVLYGAFRGARGRLWPLLARIPVLRNAIPTMVRVTSAASA